MKTRAVATKSARVSTQRVRRDVSSSSSCQKRVASRAALRAAAQRFEVGELRTSRTRYDHLNLEISAVHRSSLFVGRRRSSVVLRRASSFLVPRSSSSVVPVPRFSFLVCRLPSFLGSFRSNPAGESREDREERRCTKYLNLDSPEASKLAPKSIPE